MLSAWVQQGFFHFGTPSGRTSPTQEIRDILCSVLGLPPKAMHIASYPVGPAHRHTFWWREGSHNYSEAQFMMKIAMEYPVLSLGISVEKGREDSPANDDHTLDRASWDWSRLIASCDYVVGHVVPAISATQSRPVQLRVRPHIDGQVDRREAVTFTCADGQWFRRYEGLSSPSEIVEYLGTLDSRRDTWVDVNVTIDVAGAEIESFTTARCGEILLAFAPLREVLRGRSVDLSVAGA